MKHIICTVPHVITLGGLACAALALMSLFEGNVDGAVRYSLLVLFIDRLDGTLARTLNVREEFPGISGDVLDTITDLVGLTFVPMVLFWTQGLFVPGVGQHIAIAAIVTASWKYSRKEGFLGKGYSIGAPPVFFSVFLCYFLDLPQSVCTAYAIMLILLVLSPIRYPITSLVTTHWKPGYKSVTNYLTIIFFVPVFIMLDDAPSFIYWLMMCAMLMQLLVYPLLMQAKIIKPGFDRSF